jgi:hypothetical protein
MRIDGEMEAELQNCVCGDLPESFEVLNESQRELFNLGHDLDFS